MGTTLTAATVDDEGAHLGHVGDSQAYLLVRARSASSPTITRW
jgi:serine/threonine protein phosphatase PrpC